MANPKSYTRRRRTQAARVYLLAFALVLAGGGFLIGRFLTPPKVEVQTVEVEKPVEVEKIVEVTSTPPVQEERTYYDVPLSHSLQDFIFEICADEDVPVPLVLAMIEHESRFNPEVVSKTNDYGLMQINTVNHEWLAEEYRTADMLDPYQNVYCGVKIIGSYLERYEDTTKALMAYNMGNYGASKAWQNGITTCSYAESILSLMAEYEEV